VRLSSRDAAAGFSVTGSASAAGAFAALPRPALGGLDGALAPVPAVGLAAAAVGASAGDGPSDGAPGAAAISRGGSPRAASPAAKAAEKKLISARQKLREVRNKVEAAGGKIRASVPELLKKGDPTGGSSGRGKDGLREAVKRAQVSSGSKGKFDRLAKGEANNLQPKKRKIEMSQKPSEEKGRYLKAAERVLSSDGAVDKNKAAKVGGGDQPGDIAKRKQGKGVKGAPGSDRRSKKGNRKPKSGRAKR